MSTWSVRGLYVAVTLLFALMIGSAAGVVAYLGGESAAKAILTGGAAFVGTATFILLVIGFLEAGVSKRASP